MENQAPPDHTAEDTSFEPVIRHDKDRRFAREIAYGIQQTIACWATDFIDPPLSAWFQNKFGKKVVGQEAHTSEAFKAEAFGDTSAFFGYLLLKRMFGGPIDALSRTVRNSIDGTLSRMGKTALKPWAEAHGLTEADVRYQRRMEEYKDQQSENAVDSGIIATLATGLNVVAQKHMFFDKSVHHTNQQTYLTIAKSKLSGAALTVGLMGLLRVVFPSSMKTLDEEISDRYSSKLIRFTKKSFGVREENTPIITKTPQGQQVETTSLSPEKRDGLLAMVAEHAEKIDYQNPQAHAALIAKQKSVYQAFIAALADDGVLAEAMIHEHYETAKKSHTYDFTLNASAPDEAASRKSILASLAHKRRDMEQFIALLGDEAFLNDVQKAVETKNIPVRKNSTITSDQQRYMSESLLKQSNSDIADAAEAQALDYKALAHALKPDGNNARILAAELKKLLPDYDANDVDGIAKDYMQYYQKEALIMAEQLAPESRVVQQASQRAETLRHKYQPAESSHAAAI